MRYQTVDIHVIPGADGYRVQVDSPMGRATGTFRLPFSDLEIDNFILRIGQTRRGTRRLDSSQMAAARDFGKRLFGALIDDEIHARFSSTLDQARLSGDGAKVRLHIQHTPELADLPWEYLCNPADESFLALSTATPVIRFLQLPQPVPALPATRPLRIIGVVSSPTDVSELDVEAEKKHLEEAIAGLTWRGLGGALEIEWLSPPTLSAFQSALRQKKFHIFHFIGHGTFDPASDEGALLFENEQGRARSVSASVLGTLLRDHQTLRLAVLNACEGARTGREDPFAGVAPALVRAGLPATVAMQFEVTDEAAITFAREFYGAVADGYAVDAALAEARKAIFAGGNDVEWGTPVLFTRVDDGVIFQLPDRPLVDEATLDSLYQQVINLVREKRWQEAWDTWMALRQQAPEYPDSAHAAEFAGKQVEVAKLYVQMSGLAAARQWQKVLQVWDEILQRDAAHLDPEGLVAQAQAEIQKEQKQRAQRAHLDQLYTQLSGLVSIGRWQEARAKWQEIQRINPQYPDRDGLVSKIEAGLAQQQAQAQESQSKVGGQRTQPHTTAGTAPTFLSSCLLKSVLLSVVGIIVLAVVIAGVIIWLDRVSDPVDPLAQNLSPQAVSPASASTPTVESATPVIAFEDKGVIAPSNEAAPTATPTAMVGAIDRYFPTTVGSHWRYTGSIQGSPTAFDLLIERVEGSSDRVGLFSVNQVPVSAFRMSRVGDVLYVTEAGDIGGSRTVYNPWQPLLQEPLQEGANWEWEGTMDPFGQSSGRYETVVVNREQVTVSAGTFDTYHLRIQGTETWPLQGIVDRYTDELWLAEDVGLVKRRLVSSARGTWEFNLLSYQIEP